MQCFRIRILILTLFNDAVTPSYTESIVMEMSTNREKKEGILKKLYDTPMWREDDIKMDLKDNVTVWDGLNWLRTGFSDGLL